MQYLDSRGVGHLLHFWHDANSFQASTLTRIHSHSVCYQATSGLSETESDSDVSSPSQPEQIDVKYKGMCESSDNVKATGGEAGSSASLPSVNSSVNTGHGSCDAGQTPNTFDSSHCANTPHHLATSDSPPSNLACLDNVGRPIIKGQSNTNSAVVSETSVASTNPSHIPAERLQLQAATGVISGSPLHHSYISCNELVSSSSSSSSSVHTKVTGSPAHSLSSFTHVLPYPMNKLTLHERLLKSK